MNSSKTIAAPQQKRSQETLERLLAATIRVLAESGLDGAVIPRIAALAEVAPASVYRRFASKDALLRAAFLHLLRQANDGNRAGLAQALVRDTLEETAQCLMTLVFQQYRQHPGLLRALSRFMDTDSDVEFVAQARGIVAENLNLIVDALLVHGDQIRHQAPERALRFAVLNATTSIEVIALEAGALWQAVLPASDEELAGEFARSFVAYLRQG